MALEAGKMAQASDFATLKNRINTELQRRCHVNPINSYTISTTNPGQNTQIKATQINSIITALSKINDLSTSGETAGTGTISLFNIIEKLSEFENYGLTSSNSGCKSSCTGLCQGTSSGTCSGNCTGDCYGNCQADCASDCSGYCSGSCYAACASDCSGNCSGSCSSGCSGTCKNGCSTACLGTNRSGTQG